MINESLIHSVRCQSVVIIIFHVSNVVLYVRETVTKKVRNTFSNQKAVCDDTQVSQPNTQRKIDGIQNYYAACQEDMVDWILRKMTDMH